MGFRGESVLCLFARSYDDNLFVLPRLEKKILPVNSPQTSRTPVTTNMTLHWVNVLNFFFIVTHREPGFFIGVNDVSDGGDYTLDWKSANVVIVLLLSIFSSWEHFWLSCQAFKHQANHLYTFPDIWKHRISQQKEECLENSWLLTATLRFQAAWVRNR